MDIGDFANDALLGSKLAGCDQYLVEEILDPPIDSYWIRSQDIIKYGNTDRLKTNDFLGRLLVLGMVSAAEAYFRRVIGLCIDLCPIAKSCAIEKTINLGGLLWHNSLDLSRSAFENYSLASSKDLTKVSREFLQFDLNNKDFRDPIQSFDDICQLRHGIVHNDGLMPGKNALALEIPSFERPVRIIIRYAQIQEIAAISNTLVFLYNRKLFEEMCERWAVKWRRKKDWKPEEQDSLFTKIHSIFCTQTEIIKCEHIRDSELAACKKAVEKKYALL